MKRLALHMMKEPKKKEERSQQGVTLDAVITVCEYIETEIRGPTAEKQHIFGRENARSERKTQCERKSKYFS